MLIVKKQCTQNINLTMKDHDPSYGRYTFYGHINNSDGAKNPFEHFKTLVVLSLY